MAPLTANELCLNVISRLRAAHRDLSARIEPLTCFSSLFIVILVITFQKVVFQREAGVVHVCNEAPQERVW